VWRLLTVASLSCDSSAPRTTKNQRGAVEGFHTGVEFWTVLLFFSIRLVVSLFLFFSLSLSTHPTTQNRTDRSPAPCPLHPTEGSQASGGQEVSEGRMVFLLLLGGF
jgi:hypothetical protein